VHKIEERRRHAATNHNPAANGYPGLLPHGRNTQMYPARTDTRSRPNTAFTSDQIRYGGAPQASKQLSPASAGLTGQDYRCGKRPPALMRIGFDLPGETISHAARGGKPQARGRSHDPARAQGFIAARKELRPQ